MSICVVRSDFKECVPVSVAILAVVFHLINCVIGQSAEWRNSLAQMHSDNPYINHIYIYYIYREY
jgi:hypothetical protein